MTYSREQLQERISTLPEALREFIFSFETARAVDGVGKKYNLNETRVGNLASQIGLVLMQFVPKEKLAEQLTAEAGLAPEQARAVAGDIEKEIFQNIPRLPSGDTPLKGGIVVPQSSPLEGSTRAERGGGMFVMSRGEGMSPADTKPPLPASPLEGSTRAERGGGMSVMSKEMVSSQQNTPPRLADSAPLLNQGGDERKVPIRKIAPPPPNLPTASLPNLQTLLTDIRRGTAFDEARIDSAYRKTPIEIRQSLESIGFLSRLQGVARKFGLNVEETGELVSETGLVLLGLTKPPQFIDNLAKRLRLPRDRAFAVGQAVNMEVLRPMREIIRKMNEPDANPRIDANTANEKLKEEGGLRFAPSVPSPSRPFQDIPRPSGTPFQGGNLNSPLEGSTPTQVGGRDVSEVKKYVADPYREPLE